MTKPDIVSIIENTGVSLEKCGSVYQGFCPLHGDKESPSLKVYPTTNSWCCFGATCTQESGKQKGGDAIAWLMEKENLSYPEAVQQLEGLSTFREIRQLSHPTTRERKNPEVVAPTIVTYWHSLLDQSDRRRYFHKRGFTDVTINRELWGWDGERYTLPVWEGEPGKSRCLGTRLRASDLSTGPKYKGLSGANSAQVWGRWYCRNEVIVFAFAGEFDAARAVQDGLAAFSVVNGCRAWNRFPENWPDTWFPDTRYLICIFDEGEETAAAGMASKWADVKGIRSARVVTWWEGEGKDYCDRRDNGMSVSEFIKYSITQLSGEPVTQYADIANKILNVEDHALVR